MNTTTTTPITLCLKHALTSIASAVFSYAKRFTNKRSLARLLSTCLCSIIIVIRPFSVLGGSLAFLVLTIKELVFSVQPSFAQQLELTILNILGALLGIALSTLGKFIASRCPEDSLRQRATCAMFLVTISFFAGLTKSRLPRLTLSMRIQCFISTWILTQDIGVRSEVLRLSGNWLWITLSASVICLVSLFIVMIVIRWTSTNFERDIAKTFGVIHKSLNTGLSLAFPNPNEPPVDRKEYERLKADLLARSLRLNENYSQAAFELRIGRLSLKSIRPLISTVEHMRRELAWGMPIKEPDTRSRKSTTRGGSKPQSRAHSPDRYTNSLEHTARSLGCAVLESVSCIGRTVMLAFNQGSPPPQKFSWNAGSTAATTTQAEMKENQKDRPVGWTYSQKATLKEAEEHLRAARDAARDELKRVFNEIDSQQRDADADPHLTQDALHCSLAMIALLQMAQEIRLALQIAERFATRYEESRPRLWYPRINLSWLGVPPGSFVYDDPNAVHPVYDSSSSEETLTAVQDDNTPPEWKQGLREVHHVHVRRAALKAARLSMSAKELEEDGAEHAGWLGSIRSWFDQLVTSQRSLKLRLRLWKIIKAVKHSSHFRHALKNASGVALLTFVAFMPANSAGRKWYAEAHGQWMTISFLWVFETNTGATFRAGFLRVIGTACGALYAYITFLIARTNPYGLVVLVTASDIPITWLITQYNLGPLAVPAAVAIPPIAFARYLNPTSQPIIDLALLRAGMISAGMVCALLLNGFVFPRHCRVYFLSDTSRSVGLLTDLYLTLSHNIWHEKHAITKDDHQKTLKLELNIRSALQRLSLFIVTMQNEVGLLPKPLRHYRRVVAVLQDLLDVLTGLRKIRENIPRKLVVTEVHHERREFMSCVCVALFACQHAFKAREPLPQFLPSARHAHQNLASRVRERLRETRQEDPHDMGLSLVYSFAEQEALKNMVDALEDLLEVTGSLFGASAWWTYDTQYLSKVTLREEGDHGWYSTIRWDHAGDMV